MFSLHYSSLHTIKVSCFVSYAVLSHRRHIAGWPRLIRGLVPALWLMLVKLWDIYLHYYTLGGGAGVQIAFDRWPARFTALPLNVCQSVRILLFICGALELTCVFV